MVTGPFFSDSSKDRRGCNCWAPAASPAVNAVRLTVSVPVCSTGATSPFPLPPEINRQRKWLRGRIIRCCISHPVVARSKSRPDVRCLSSSGYIKDGKVKCPGRANSRCSIVLTYQRCMLTAGFPDRIPARTDITNPELSGGKNAGRRKAEYDRGPTRAPAPTPHTFELLLPLRGRFVVLEF